MTSAVTKPAPLSQVIVRCCIALLVYLKLALIVYLKLNDSSFLNSTCHMLIYQEHTSTIMGYSRDELLNLRDSVPSSYRLPISTWKTIRNFGICRTPRTHRGTRGGNLKLSSPPAVNHMPNTDYQRPQHDFPRNKSTKCSVAVWNARSIRHKTTMCSWYIMENSIDMMFITESWLSGNPTDDVIIGEVTPPGYQFFNIPRISDNNGGGIAVIFKEELGLRTFPTGHTFTTFEHA